MFWAINDNYEINIDGCVRNTKTKRVLKPFMNGNYHSIWLGAGNKRYVHRLVAEIFLVPPTDSDCVVDHINRNKLDNSAVNLRWVSRSQNNTNRTLEEKARQTSKTKEHHITKDPWNRYIVRIVIAKHQYYKYFKTIEEAKLFRDTLIETYRNERR